MTIRDISKLTDELIRNVDKLEKMPISTEKTASKKEAAVVKKNIKVPLAESLRKLAKESRSYSDTISYEDVDKYIKEFSRG